MFSRSFCLITTTFVILSLVAISDVYSQEISVKVKSRGKEYFGKKLAYDGRDMVLLRQDGRISVLRVSKKSDIKKASQRFEPYKSEVLRQQLQKEFGSKYQVSRTQNFVVVHPPGDFNTWAMPFEQLYQRFRNYFSSRGFSLGQPEFPMVAVVLRTRKEFDKFLTTYHEASPNTLGYYSQKSNRIITYNPNGRRPTKRDWMFSATLIHEAVHQTSFNIGLHKRFAFTPVWVLEGLACMFEAKGVHNNMYYSELKDRINKTRLTSLQHYYRQKRVQGKLLNFVASDKVFKSNQAVAYAYSWGLTFFLAEKYPDKLLKYLKEDAKRQEFREFTAQQRVKAFKRAFGDDLKGLEKRMERFIMKLTV